MGKGKGSSGGSGAAGLSASDLASLDAGMGGGSGMSAMGMGFGGADAFAGGAWGDNSSMASDDSYEYDWNDNGQADSKPKVIVMEDGTEVIVDRSSMFAEQIEMLSEKRTSTREVALTRLVKMLTRNVAVDCVESRLETTLEAVLTCVRKGGAKESPLAARVLGLIALTIGPDRQDIFESMRKVLEKVVVKGKAYQQIGAAVALSLSCFLLSSEEADTWTTMETFAKLFSPEHLTRKKVRIVSFCKMPYHTIPYNTK